MLGRLCISVPECTEVYKSVLKQAFTPRRRLAIPASPNGQYLGRALERALEQSVAEQCKTRWCNQHDCNHEDLLFRDTQCCKTHISPSASDVEKNGSWANGYEVSSLQSQRAISQPNQHLFGTYSTSTVI